jgi:uncharacterized RDD family membrane protein YckC
MPDNHVTSPLDRLAGLVPVDALLRQVDINELLDRVDIERLVARVDLDAIVEQSVKAATRGVLDLLRDQLARLDAIITQAMDRIVRRGRQTETPTEVRVPTAGPATRLPAFVIDLVFALLTFATMVAAAIACVDFVTGAALHIQIHPEIGIPSIVAWLFLYFFGSWATVGRTPGMALLGVRVVAGHSEIVPAGRAAVRTLVLPVAFIGGLGLLGILLGRNHRGLQDVAAGTLVVYASASQPTT